MKVVMPTSLEEATSRLEGLERLLVATGWERDAIVATFVRLDRGTTNRSSMVINDHALSAREFAEKGIRGLTSHVTVSECVRRWSDATGGKYPEPGEAVELPTTRWVRTLAPDYHLRPSHPLVTPATSPTVTVETRIVSATTTETQKEDQIPPSSSPPSKRRTPSPSTPSTKGRSTSPPPSSSSTTRRPRRLDGKSSSARAAEVKALIKGGGDYGKLLRLSVEMSKLVEVVRAYDPTYFVPDRTMADVDPGINIINDFHNDLMDLSRWIDEALVATNAWLGDLQVQKKIEVLRDPTGRTPPEIEAGKRAAKRLERTMGRQLPR